MYSNTVLFGWLTLAIAHGVVAESTACPDYSDFSQQQHAPLSSGRFKLSQMRPAPNCRTFVDAGVDDTIAQYESIIKDPDLYRLFQNSYPNTLDTAIKWKGYAANDPTEELTFVITGDINAMWFRDSANQMQSYMPLLNASSNSSSLASLYRGVINLQSRYMLYDPFCNSYQPPIESKVPPSNNGASTDDTVHPGYDNTTVFECKYELDSLAAFLELSSDYYSRTKDATFFGKYQWVAAVNKILETAEAMMTPTYMPDGSVAVSPYTFTRQTTAGTETLSNSGIGNPVAPGTGLIRSAFRPSDDATIFQLFIPANMMFSTKLASAAPIAAAIGQQALADKMNALSSSLRTAILAHGVVLSPNDGIIYAYEVDGYGSRNLMDDANIPSLLSAPFFGYTSINDPVYQATRRKILSVGNPYFMHGPVLNATGGPHDGPGHAWPMGAITQILTSNDASEVEGVLQMLVSSTAGLGLIHESINSFSEKDWTRQWFSWANGLFGQMILDVEQRMPQVLARSYQ